MRIRYYLRYADDFIIIHNDANYLRSLVDPIQNFLSEKLNLQLHPKKLSLRKLSQGIDFVGYVLLPHHIALRKKTTKRMLRKLNFSNISSYLGLIKHANAYNLEQTLLKMVCDEDFFERTGLYVKSF